MISLFFVFLLFFYFVKSQNCLFRGETLTIGSSLYSSNGLYNLTIMTKGNVCVYDGSGKRWCSGYLSPSSWEMILTSSGNFGVVKTNGICVWAPNNPITTLMPNIEYIIMSNNANFIVYDNIGLAWSCNRGTFTNPSNYSCIITSIDESIGDTCNNSPTASPTSIPTTFPSVSPTSIPSTEPSIIPSTEPTIIPSTEPSIIPSTEPTIIPSTFPSTFPTIIPSTFPTTEPTIIPSTFPTISTSTFPTISTSTFPSVSTSTFPSVNPTRIPSTFPSSPIRKPPTKNPTRAPTVEPTIETFIPTPEP
jgi:hypothetical protein